MSNSALRIFGVGCRSKMLAFVMIFVLASLTGSLGAALASPTQKLIGAWSGRGTAVFEGNKSERIKCNAYYTGAARKINIAVRCASASYKIEIRSKLTNSSGRLTGTWEERTFNAAGDTNGSINDERLRLTVRGGGLTASMRIDFEDTAQNIYIRTRGVKLKSVQIALSKSD